MHFYPFNIPDYRQDAGHLTLEEHYIYRHLIDEYYLEEAPLTLDKRMLMRRMRLTPDQAWALDSVLEEFFSETDNGYIHTRIEAELSTIYAKSDKARESANMRWHRNANAPKKNATAMRTHTERNASAMLPKTEDLIPNTKETTSSEKPAASSPVPYQKIVDLYHEHCPKFPRVVKLSAKRKKHMSARWKDEADNLEFWATYFKHAATSNFLGGSNDRSWKADIDFLISERAMIGMQEGKYHHG